MKIIECGSIDHEPTSAVEGIEVGQVLGPPTRCLVAAQIVKTDEQHHDLIELDFDAVSVAIIERDTIDRREEIDPQRRIAQLYDPMRLQEICRRQPNGAEPEVIKGTQQPLRVVGMDEHPHIEITCIARGPCAATA